MKTQEIECRFLEIDKDALIAKLKDLGAQDMGEKLLEETIIYDAAFKMRDLQQMIRLRRAGEKTLLTYKDHSVPGVDSTYEIEFEVGDYAKAALLFEKIGFVPFRRQEKRRHTFNLGGVAVEIDTWPKIPTYVELEGESEEALRAVAQKLDLNWEKADFHSARWVIENVYKIPFSRMRWFTFSRFEE